MGWTPSQAAWLERTEGVESVIDAVKRTQTPQVSQVREPMLLAGSGLKLVINSSKCRLCLPPFGLDASALCPHGACLHGA